MLDLLNKIKSSGFFATPDGWVKKRSSKVYSHVQVASEIDPSDVDLPSKVKHAHSQEILKKEESTPYPKDFEDRYNEYIIDKYNEIDRIIWGDLYKGVYNESGIDLFFSRVSDNNEFVELSSSEQSLKDMFATSYIIVDGEKVRRSEYFYKVISNIIEHFPTVSYKPTDLSVFSNDKILLSPIIVRNFFALQPIRNDNKEIIGYRMEFNTKTTLTDYYHASRDIMLGNVKEVGRIESLSNDKSIPSVKYFDIACFEEPGEYPAWRAFMNGFKRKEASEVFMAWVWGLFDCRNKSAQAMWLHGHGGDGKSSVIQVLQEILNGAAGTISDKQIASGFALENLLCKRIAIYGDVKNVSIVHTEEFHKTTTGDPVTVNRKNKTPFTTSMYIKWLLAANSSPNINTDEENQLRRIIYIYMNKKDNEQLLADGLAFRDVYGNIKYCKNISDYKDDLKKEFKYFMNGCKKAYERLCVNHGDIAMPQSLTDDLYTLNDPVNDAIKEVLDNAFTMVPANDLNVKECSSYKDVMDIIHASIGLTYQTKDLKFRLNDILTNKYGKFDKSFSVQDDLGKRLSKLIVDVKGVKKCFIKCK